MAEAIKEENQEPVNKKKGKKGKQAVAESENDATAKPTVDKQIESMKEAWEKEKERLDKEKLLKIYELFEKPMVNLLSQMEIEGIKINSSFLKELSKKFDNKIKKLEKEIFSIAKREFNIGSPKQLGEILYKELKIAKKKTAGAYNPPGYNSPETRGGGVARNLIDSGFVACLDLQPLSVGWCRTAVWKHWV